MLDLASQILAGEQKSEGSSFVDFSGRRVGFNGAPDGYYNIIEDANHRVVMHLKPAESLTELGMHVDGVGIFYRGLNILVELQEDSSLQVRVDGKQLGMDMRRQLSKQLYSMVLPAGSIAISRLASGSELIIETDLLEIRISRTESGGDSDHLSFSAALLFPPEHLEGIWGEGYNRAVAGAAHGKPDNDSPKSSPNDYKLPGYFPGAAFPVLASGGDLDAAKATYTTQRA
ncbi:g11181 [Coccomyxa viridis]|uniref:G11181 protein n=1 Tax=Coccomyxa viridis TaxID=1274662 RepID=A0ABP1G7C8_9CHLO